MGLTGPFVKLPPIGPAHFAELLTVDLGHSAHVQKIPVTVSFSRYIEQWPMFLALENAMNNTTELPYIANVVSYIVNARFQDSISVLNTAQNIHDCLLVPCPLSADAPLLAFYPPLQAVSLAHPLTIKPEVQVFIEQLPPSSASTIFDTDVLFPARARLIQAYRQALLQRVRRIAEDTTRIDAPFPPMTLEERQERVSYIVDRAITIPIAQTVDWWADVTCGVMLTSPSDAALAKLMAISGDESLKYRTINSWRQIGNIIELLER